MEYLIGDANDELNALQTIVRAIIIFISALLCIRISGMRAFGKNSALDVVVNIIVGSVLARAIGGHVPFFPSIAAAFAFSLIHRILAMLATRSDMMSNLLKGKEYPLIKDGKMIPENMRYCNITKGDLLEGIRLTANVNGMEEIKEAYFERSGQISAIPKDKQ
jgi:uncharacterized membrane protein YcaP (DUF421 family)